MIKIVIVLTLILSTSTYAQTNADLQLLYGNFDGNTAMYDTEDGGGKSTLTYESFSYNKVGDLYAFLDYMVANDTLYVPGSAKGTQTAFYGEIQPRLSLSYVTDHTLSFGLIQDIFVATQLNAGSGADYKAAMIGLGINADLIGFDSFATNIYIKNENFKPSEYYSRNTVQISLAYATVFGTSGFSFNGWLDWTPYNIQTQNQLLYKVFSLADEQSIDLGFEYLYYQEQSDISNNYTYLKTSVLQIMVRYLW